MIDIAAVESMRWIATVFFIAAVVHTFASKKIIAYGHRFEPGSVKENFFHFLGEIEIVFGVWAAALVTVWSFRFGTVSAISFIESVDFTEAAFVFVIMCMSATRPVLSLARWAINMPVYVSMLDGKNQT